MKIEGSVQLDKYKEMSKQIKHAVKKTKKSFLELTLLRLMERDTTRRQPFLWRKTLNDDDDEEACVPQKGTQLDFMYNVRVKLAFERRLLYS